MTLARLKELLEERQVRYETIQHERTITAQETAQATHIRGKEFAKTVVVRLDDHLAMVVLPASMMIDLDLLKRATGARQAAIAEETELAHIFPECEPGAMPPFGSLYGMEVFVADLLGENEHIAFNAGSHTELMQMAYRDFERLTAPVPIRVGHMLH